MKVVVVLLAALAAVSVPTASAHRARSLDTLQLKGVFKVKWDAVTCPAGTPQSTACWLWAGPGTVPGLGATHESYVLLLDTSNGDCYRASWQAALTVSGKGEIDAAMQIPGCVGGPSKGSPPGIATFTITGGSGIYTDATGSGTLASSYIHETGPGPAGTATDTWLGTLTVSGLTFDLTPPVISGAVSKTVRVAKTAKFARVAFKVTAKDAVDGTVPVSCKPRSGSHFKIGRTNVKCSATDSSANTATKSFTVTVKRR